MGVESRHVGFGAAGAFVVHAAIAVTVGVVLFHLLPHQAVDAIVSLMFLVGALLALREAAKERQERSIVEREVASGRRVVTTAFVVIFLAEWGRPHSDSDRQPGRSLPFIALGRRGRPLGSLVSGRTRRDRGARSP